MLVTLLDIVFILPMDHFQLLKVLIDQLMATQADDPKESKLLGLGLKLLHELKVSYGVEMRPVWLI